MTDEIPQAALVAALDRLNRWADSGDLLAETGLAAKQILEDATRHLKEQCLGEVREALRSLPRFGDGIHHQDAKLIDLDAALATFTDQSSKPQRCRNCGRSPGQLHSDGCVIAPDLPVLPEHCHKPDCESSTECAERSDDWLGRTLDRAHQSVEERPEYLKPARYRSGRVECDNCLKEKPDVRWVGGEEGAYVCADCIAESSESSTESYGKDGSELRSADKPSITESSTDQVGERQRRIEVLADRVMKQLRPADAEWDMGEGHSQPINWPEVIGQVLHYAEEEGGASPSETADEFLRRAQRLEEAAAFIRAGVLDSPTPSETPPEQSRFTKEQVREKLADLASDYRLASELGGDEGSLNTVADEIDQFADAAFGDTQPEHPEQTGRAVSGSELDEKGVNQNGVQMCECRRYGPPHAYEPGESCTPNGPVIPKSAQSPKTGGEG